MRASACFFIFNHHSEPEAVGTHVMFCAGWGEGGGGGGAFCAFSDGNGAVCAAWLRNTSHLIPASRDELISLKLMDCIVVDSEAKHFSDTRT